MLRVELLRLFDTEDSTIGVMGVNGEPTCFTLEDEGRDKKLPKETRIPAGRYKLKLRTHGGFHQRYSQRFAGIHKGMIEVCDVPGFTDILIHLGNTDEDTAGCILVGFGADVRSERLTRSTDAYLAIYTVIADQLVQGNECELVVYDRII